MVYLVVLTKPCFSETTLGTVPEAHLFIFQALNIMFLVDCSSSNGWLWVHVSEF